MHFMIKTYPNLAYFVSQLAEFDNNLTDKYWKALKKVLYYLQKLKILIFTILKLLVFSAFWLRQMLVKQYLFYI